MEVLDAIPARRTPVRQGVTCLGGLSDFCHYVDYPGQVRTSHTNGHHLESGEGWRDYGLLGTELWAAYMETDAG